MSNPIPPEDTLARYCKPSNVSSGGEPMAAAFELKSSDKGYLSSNWLEYFKGKPRSEQLELVRSALASHLTLSKNGKIALLNVERMINHVRSNAPSGMNIISAMHLNKRDPSYSGIFGLVVSDKVVPALIKKIIQETHEAVI